MPIYEYHCNACSANVELLVRNDSETPECSACGSSDLDKQWSVPASPQNGGGQLPVVPGGCGADACQRGCQFG